MPPQGRLGDKANVPADAHGCPGCPHPGVGPAVCGSEDVMVNSRPAVRVDDTGIHAACCNQNTWTAKQGSGTVFINNKAAHRLGDQTKHCGGMGQLIEGSDNVIVGGSSSGGGGGGGGGASPTNDGGAGTSSSTQSISGINSNATGSGSGGAGASPTPAASTETPPPPPPPADAAPEDDKPKKNWFELRLVDEVGDPIAGVDIRLAYDGTTKTVPTDGDGVARVDGATGAAGQATVVSRSKLRAALKSRWAKGRTPKPPSGHGVSVQALDDQLEPVKLTKEYRGTLSVTPFFSCAEIPGAHFAFARSFPTKDALQPLAELAEAMHAKDEEGQPLERKALIFGHSDKSGSEELNKELSERRAKAIFALLTHDDKKWEQLYKNKPKGKHWSEEWDVWEAQHMMNALGCGDADGNPLKETGVRDAKTKQAINRFQAGEYPDKPAEQKKLAKSDYLGEDGRREMFFAYAKKITREPVPKDRFVEGDGQPFVGCGEFNPLSISVKDAESRRVVLMMFDGASGPADPLPCKVGSVAPCREESSKPLSEMPVDGSPPYRCGVYKKLATQCPCKGGPDLSHDVIVRLGMTTKRAGEMPHTLILESDDNTISRSQAIKSDARASEDHLAELHFEHVPDWHSYQLRAVGGDPSHTVFPFTPFEDLDKLPLASTDEIAEQTPAWLAVDNAPPAPAPTPASSDLKDLPEEEDPDGTMKPGGLMKPGED